MPEASHARNFKIALMCALGVLAIDRATKDWVWSALRDEPPVKLIEGWLHLDFAFNTGSAFGLAAGQPWATALFSMIALAVIVSLFLLLWRVRPKHTLAALGVGLSAGGAAGNLLCRITRVHDMRVYGLENTSFNDLIEFAPQVAEAFDSGPLWIDIPRRGVVDFIVVYYQPLHPWPAFNVADIALTLGALSLIAWVWREDEEVFGSAGDDAVDPANER
jgi:signal peptidase II